MAVMDIIINAYDKASDVIEKVGDKSGKVAESMEKNWLKIGMASAAAGVAIEGMARQQAPLTENTQKLAAALSMTEEEMRGLVLETTNVTRPIGDVIGLFEVARQQGMETGEEVKRFAETWDTVADATGESSVALAEASIGLRSLGIESHNQGEAMGAFGYILENTTFSVGDFLEFVKLTGPELRQVGLDVDNTAAIVGLLENKFGLTGRTLRTEFRQAVNAADGDINMLYESLGITAEEVEEYSGKVAESSDIIERNAEIHGQSYTAMQKIQQRVAEVSYEYGGLFQAMSALTPVMLGLGPAIKGITLAKTALSKAGGIATVVTKGLGVALKFLAANPVGVIIVAVAALVAGIIYLYKNNEKVRDFMQTAWHNIQMFVLQSVEKMLGGIEKFVSWIPGVGNKVDGLRDKITGMINTAETNRRLAQFQKNTTENWARIGDTVETANYRMESSIEKVNVAKEKAVVKSSDLQRAEEHLARAMEEQRRELIREVDRMYDALKRSLKSYHEDSRKVQEDALRAELDNARRVSNEKIAQYDREYMAKLKTIDEELAREIELREAEIAALDDKTKEEDKILREQENERRLQDLREQIAAEADAKRRIDLEARLQDEIAKQERDRLLDSRRAQQNALREEIMAIRTQTDVKKDQLKQEYDDKKEAETKALEVTVKRIEAEQRQLKDHYEFILSEENLNAEARKLIVEENQDEIIALLEEYEKDWRDAGKSFGERMADGLLDAMPSVKQAVNSLFGSVTSSGGTSSGAGASAPDPGISSGSSGGGDDLVPIRAFFESQGKSVSWDAATGTVQAGNVVITPAHLEGGRSYAPISELVSLLPDAHTGGKFRSKTPGGEGLVLLKDNEEVLQGRIEGSQGRVVVYFGRGAFEGAIITDDYGIDRLMERVFERMQARGVKIT